MECYEYDYIITKPELNEDLLMHFGVKGMRWGHRKARPVGNGRRVGRRDPTKSFGYKLASGPFGQAGLKAGQRYQKRKLNKSLNQTKPVKKGREALKSKMQNPETQKRVKTALKAAAITAGVAVAAMGVHTFVTSPYAKGNRMYVAGKTKEFIYNQGRKFADSVVQRRKNRAARKYVKTLPRIGAKKIIDTTARFV